MFSISLERCEVKAFEGVFQKFVEEFNDFAGEMFSDPCIPLEEAEFRVFEASRSWCQKFLEIFISQKASEQSGEPVECPELQYQP